MQHRPVQCWGGVWEAGGKRHDRSGFQFADKRVKKKKKEMRERKTVEEGERWRKLGSSLLRRQFAKGGQSTDHGDGNLTGREEKRDKFSEIF